MITLLQVIFWVCICIIFYAYIGYGLILFILVKVKRLINKHKEKSLQGYNDENLPEVTVLVAAYNEKDYIESKILNTFALDYPKNKLKLLFVTDGSNDGTPEIVSKYKEILLLHQDLRQGKIAAVKRSMPFIKTPITVFTDANTLLNKEALKKMIRHYADPFTGAVAGEKRIAVKSADAASGSGEGIYWKYESKLKQWDSELYSVVGAAGELFSIRTDLFVHVPSDTLIEDFYMTLKIAENGYRVIYEPEAYAEEGPSASVKEELKRKVRIAAGGIQAVIRLAPLLNIFNHGVLSFQYISHRVLRWTLAPLSLLILLFINIYLALINLPLYTFLLFLQIIFYLVAFAGWMLKSKKIKIKGFFVPYYFLVMNVAVYLGFFRYIKGSQSVVWEKAKRAA